MDQRLNYKIDPAKITDTKYAWVHVSCASFIPDVKFTFRSAVKLSKLKENSFEKTCIICHQRHGACVKCSHPSCQIYMHAECARRAQFYLDIDREISNHDDLEKQDNYEKKTKRLEYRTTFNRKVFCEPHRPFELIKEIEEKQDI